MNALVDLLPSLFEKVGIIVIAAFLLSYMKPFRQMIGHEHEMSKKILFIALFGTFGIISNYTGIEIGNHAMPEGDWHAEIAPDNAIANTRIMGVAIGGLLGGPFVGLGVGLIAGLHRYFLGGFTAGACAIAAILHDDRIVDYRLAFRWLNNNHVLRNLRIRRRLGGLKHAHVYVRR